MSEDDKKEIINNALEAGPTIPFPNFSILFKTWLEILTEFSEKHRRELFASYINEVSRSPSKLINFNLDKEILLLVLVRHKDKISDFKERVKSFVDWFLPHPNLNHR